MAVIEFSSGLGKGSAETWLLNTAAPERRQAIPEIDCEAEVVAAHFARLQLEVDRLPAGIDTQLVHRPRPDAWLADVERVVQPDLPPVLQGRNHPDGLRPVPVPVQRIVVGGVLEHEARVPKEGDVASLDR